MSWQQAHSVLRVAFVLAFAFSLSFVAGCFCAPLGEPAIPPPGGDQSEFVAEDPGQTPQTPPEDSDQTGSDGGASGGSGDGTVGPPPPDDDEDSSGDGAGDGEDDTGGDGDDDGPPAVVPQIAGIPDETVLVGEPYTGPTPELLQGTPPISWSLEVGPGGMTISEGSGIVSWGNPVEGEHPIVIAASGPGGVDTEGWGLLVESEEGQVVLALVSIGLDGEQANEESQSGSASADGRFVTFSSQASNLVAEDNNDQRDVFLRDRVAEVTTRVSMGHDAFETDAPSLRPVIAACGTFVAFQSSATNLVEDDTNSASDVFVWNCRMNQMSRVSVDSNGIEGNDSSESAAISGDGRYVVFESMADNLVPGDNNGTRDVFVHDRQTGQTRRVSESSHVQEANDQSFDAAISADGAYVVFASRASNLVVDDTNGVADIFLHELLTGQTVRVSHGAGGFETDGDSLNPHLAGPDAQFIVFESDATNISAADVNGVRDVYMFSRSTGATVAVSVLPSGETGDGASGAPMVSGDGRYIVFESLAADLVGEDNNGESDVFVRDTWTGTTMLRSIDGEGVQGNAGSTRPRLTPDGRLVVFESKATNLTEEPVSDFSDIFIRSLAE